MDDLLRFDVRGRTALVPGASYSLGVAIAPPLADAGAPFALPASVEPGRVVAGDAARLAR